MIHQTVFPIVQGMPFRCYIAIHFCIPSSVLYINNYVHTGSKSGTLQFSILLYFSLLPTRCRASFVRQCCMGTITIFCLQKFSLAGNEVNNVQYSSCISNVHKRTSAKDFRRSGRSAAPCYCFPSSNCCPPTLI